MEKNATGEVRNMILTLALWFWYRISLYMTCVFNIWMKYNALKVVKPITSFFFEYALSTAPKLNVQRTFKIRSDLIWKSVGRPLDVQTYFERPVNVHFRCYTQWVGTLAPNNSRYHSIFLLIFCYPCKSILLPYQYFVSSVLCNILIFFLNDTTRCSLRLYHQFSGSRLLQNMLLVIWWVHSNVLLYFKITQLMLNRIIIPDSIINQYCSYIAGDMEHIFLVNGLFWKYLGLSHYYAWGVEGLGMIQDMTQIWYA